jgi:hypothetical protein
MESDGGLLPVVRTIPSQAHSGSNVADISDCFACEFWTPRSVAHFTTTARTVSAYVGYMGSVGPTTHQMTMIARDSSFAELPWESRTLVLRRARAAAALLLGAPVRGEGTPRPRQLLQAPERHTASQLFATVAPAPQRPGPWGRDRRLGRCMAGRSPLHSLEREGSPEVRKLRGRKIRSLRTSTKLWGLRRVAWPRSASRTAHGGPRRGGVPSRSNARGQ